MAKRGDIARQNVQDIIVKAFGADCVGVQDKKIYVYADDGGEKIQFAVSITMPKVPVTCGGSVGSNETAGSVEVNTSPAASPVMPIELSAEDKAKVAELMKTLGLN